MVDGRGDQSPKGGGIVNTENVCVVTDGHFEGDDYVITHTGPENILNLEFSKPADWPVGVDFIPGTLTNIEHIAVLTMENRSFDNMLGYLSLPPDKGGMGRTDVDGLKGGEFNLLQDGTRCEPVPFEPQETVFPDEPPHDFDLVRKAINGGKMDGFVQSMAELHGSAVAPCIMAYNTGERLPVYDALARDFPSAIAGLPATLALLSLTAFTS